MTDKIPVAIVGSGNIGTDLMFKIIRLSDKLEVRALVGVDPQSDGLARAARLGIGTTSEGIDGLTAIPGGADVRIIFDATSAGAHPHNYEVAKSLGAQMIDLTPAAIGPYTVPVVNLEGQSAESFLAADNVNMVTCGGQATIPMVAAVRRVCDVPYAEIVASIASKSAGPGTRANIDEFTETTSRAIVTVGGARRGKAIIILNPAEPPLIMRDTVFCLIDDADGSKRAAVEASIEEMVASVAAYVPGYRLKQKVQFSAIDADEPVHTLTGPDVPRPTTKVSVFLEVEGAAHYLPAYAGNLDIMTSAALQVADQIAARAADEVTVASS